MSLAARAAVRGPGAALQEPAAMPRQASELDVPSARGPTSRPRSRPPGPPPGAAGRPRLEPEASTQPGTRIWARFSLLGGVPKVGEPTPQRCGGNWGPKNRKEIGDSP